MANNVAKPPIPVRHASLTRSSNHSYFKSECPACHDGVLTVTRDATTYRLRREDRCLACGQEFIYLDDSIGGEMLPPLREHE